MVVSRDVAFAGEDEKPLVDFNTLVFGGLAVVSLAIFLFIGRFKAFKSQRERDDRIDWSKRQFSLWKIALYSLGVVLAIVLVTQVL
ncbi:hypothetical protein N8Z26_02540 [Burkholderiales bacterium]|nr:hypothetical protein [Burkholderiales bacterium]